MPADICARCKEPVALARDDDGAHYYVHTKTWFCPAAEGGDAQ
ncbi:hypothetical protein [Prescottella equi]